VNVADSSFAAKHGGAVYLPERRNSPSYNEAKIDLIDITLKTTSSKVAANLFGQILSKILS